MGSVKVVKERKKIDVRMPEGMIKAVEQIAEDRSVGKAGAERVRSSDIVREALSHYLAKHDIIVDPEMQWGGDRRKQPDLVPA